jgi:hypothetical protein
VVGVHRIGYRPYDSLPAEAITVDIVSPNDLVGSPGEPGPAPPGGPAGGPEKAPSFEAPAPQAQPQNAPPQAAARPPQPAAPQPQRPPQPTAAPTPPASPRNTRQAAAPAPPMLPQFMPQPEPPQPQPTPAAPHEPTAADMFGMPLTMPDGKLGGGFDAPAVESAKIERDDIRAFRDHLKTCSTLPDSVPATEKTKLEVLERSVVNALRACQPFTMLPADKYAEWKVLDMSFTRQDFVGK